MKVTLSSPEPETPQSCNGQKRTVSEAGLDPSDARGSRKRAAKACQSCRSRKVRCSVSDHGVPCYNCKLDELECVIPERKRPARTAKRDKQLVAAIQGAGLRMGNLTSRTGNFSSNAARRPSSSTVDSDWEGECGHGQSVGAPSSISASSTDQNITQGTDGQRTPGPFELPHCDDELTNWLNVMPARVVDKLFEYLQTLSERGQRESLQCKLRQANFTPYEGIQHAFPNLNNRHRSGNSNTHEDPQLRMATRTNSSNLSHAFEPLSPQSPTETHTPVNIGYQNNMSLLQQLRDSHASASRTMSILETTIRKVDSQLASQRLVRPHANAIGRLPLPLTTTTMPTTGSFPPSTTRNPLSTLTPPPENRSSYSMTLEQLEKMFAPSAHREIGASNLEYRVPKSQLGDGAVAKMESVADCGLAPNRAHGHAAAKEEDFQEAFDSLIDFGGGDAFFQNFDLGTA